MIRLFNSNFMGGGVTPPYSRQMALLIGNFKVFIFVVGTIAIKNNKRKKKVFSVWPYPSVHRIKYKQEKSYLLFVEIVIIFFAACHFLMY